MLHFVAVAQLVLPPIARLGAVNLALGVALIGIGCAVHFPLFASDALSWIGFSAVKPGTEDFVPLLPWSGVVLLGIGSTILWRQVHREPTRAGQRAPGPLWQLPALLGRWPLTIYMVHQPILFGLFDLVGKR